MSYFEPQFENQIEGQINSVTVVDPARPDHTPNFVLDPSKPFDINIEWELNGSQVPLYIDHPQTATNWTVNVFAESLGPGPELVIYNGSEAKGTGALSMSYSHSATVAAGSLSEHIPNTQSGMYKLVVTVFLNSTTGFGYDIAGCFEGPIIMVENPV
jgi:hypothetical protein